MAELITSKDSGLDIGSRPDFSGFDTQVVSWSLNLHNHIDKEDSCEIALEGSPTWEGSAIALGMGIQIPIGQTSKLDMVVSNISYSEDPGRIRTSLQLTTRKILIDQVIPGGFHLDNPGPSIADAFKAISDKLDLGVKEIRTVNLSSDKFPAGKLSLTGKDNVLDYLKKAMEVNKQPIFDWWIDAFNVLNITPAYVTTANHTLSFDSFQVQSFSVNLRQKWESKEIQVAANQGSVGTGSPESVDIGYGATETTTSNKKIVRRKRVGADSSASHLTTTTKKIAIKDYVASLTIAGAYLFPINEGVELKGFRTGNDTYQLIGLSMRDDGESMYTTLTLASPRISLNGPQGGDSSRKEIEKKNKGKLVPYAYDELKAGN